MGKIYIANKKRKLENIQKEFPNAYILDLTSTSTAYARKLSPFYPHGNIPIPFSPGYTASCVEAVWQGLKVFENSDVDVKTFQNATMKNIKRTVRKFGKPLGHRKGIHGNELLNYFDARMLIYVPTYKYVLDNIPDVKTIMAKIKEQVTKSDIVFLDYNTNDDVRNTAAPISHAGLVKLYIEGSYPIYSPDMKPYTAEEMETLKRQKKEAKKARQQSSNSKRKQQSSKRKNISSTANDRLLF